jgi:hypothetical protein
VNRISQDAERKVTRRLTKNAAPWDCGMRISDWKEDESYAALHPL